MTAAPQTYVSVEDYLQRERAAEGRSEYFRGQIYAMSGGTLGHSLIIRNLIAGLHQALAGGSCQVFPNDLRVKCPTGLYTYPDVSIVCGPPELEDRYKDTLLNPRVLIEVLSPSTERYNRGDKFDHYSTIPSLREYVLIATETADIDHYVRDAADQLWRHSPLRSIESSLALASANCVLPLKSIYDGVTLEPISFPISPRITPSPEQNGSAPGTKNP
jgi:Uma2 family endonuclease